MNSSDVFDAIWKVLEERSYVDGIGGTEYARVRACWDNGEPIHLATEAAWKVIRCELESHLMPLLDILLAASVAVYQEANKPAGVPEPLPLGNETVRRIAAELAAERRNGHGN